MKSWRRWLRRLRPSRGGLVRACWKVGLTGALFFALTSPAVAFYDTPGLNGIASKLAGRKVTIHCLTPQESAADPIILWGASAYVEGISDPVTGRWVPFNYAVFAYGQCETLTAIAAGDLSGRDFDSAVWAVMVITHESGHLKGKSWSYDEAKTQCWALRHMKSTLWQLGVRDPAVVSFYTAWALDIQKEMPPEYQPAQCRYPVP